MATTEAQNAHIPQDCYKLKVLDTKKGKTEKGDFKLIHEMEFADNPPINVEGESVDINGLKLTKHSVLTEKALRFFNLERRALGLPPISSVAEFSDIDPLEYKGAKGFAICSSKVTEKKNDITGEVIINPYTKKPMVDSFRQLDQWIAPEEN